MKTHRACTCVDAVWTVASPERADGTGVAVPVARGAEIGDEAVRSPYTQAPGQPALRAGRVRGAPDRGCRVLIFPSYASFVFRVFHRVVRVPNTAAPTCSYHLCHINRSATQTTSPAKSLVIEIEPALPSRISRFFFA